MSDSILWHDYETWGVDPKRDYPVQFAAVRTDLALNPIGKPLNYFCQIPNDYLPHPQACLVTGISPQLSLRDGSIEADFALKIHQQMMQSQTCTAGYNSLKFDEEVSRNLFYRNFYSVYEREYSQGNSRWDIIDLVRAAYALRPDGINWPHYEDGKPCFKLEALSEANELEHGAAHDALSDVYATIALAKLIKEKQAKLYDFYWQLRDKHKVLEQINLQERKPFLHISGYISSERGCCTWLMPICQHPSNKNSVVCVDLSKDISIFDEYSYEQLSDSSLSDELYQQKRVPIMQIAINKVPFVAPAKMLTEENAQRLGIDRERCLAHYQQLKQSIDIANQCQALSQRNFDDDTKVDIDAQLYTREFPSAADKQVIQSIRGSEAEQLSGIYDRLENGAYRQQLFRYMGRNYPSVLNEKQIKQWQMHREERFIHGSDSHYLTIEAYQQQIQALAQQHSHDAKKISLLKQLERYAREL